MAKNSRGTSTPDRQEQDMEKKQQKKQAKKEARMMLAVEQAEASLEKARGKLARAQARVQAREAHLRNLEAALASQRASSRSDQAEAPDTGFDYQQDQPEQQGLAAVGLNPAREEPPDGIDHSGDVQTEGETSPAASAQEQETANSFEQN